MESGGSGTAYTNTSQNIYKSDGKCINKDELIGYILRKSYENHNKNYNYEDIKNILELENNFIR